MTILKNRWGYKSLELSTINDPENTHHNQSKRESFYVYASCIWNAFRTFSRGCHGV